MDDQVSFQKASLRIRSGTLGLRTQRAASKTKTKQSTSTNITLPLLREQVIKCVYDLIARCVGRQAPYSPSV